MLTVAPRLLQANQACDGYALTALSCSPDGTRLAVGGYSSTVEVWSLERGICCSTYRGHSSVVTDLSWSPDSRYVASSSWDGSVQVWDAASGDSVSSYWGYRDDSASTRVLCVSWSPNGRYLASAATDWTIRLWPIEQPKWVKVLSEHQGGVLSIAWAGVDRHLLSAGQDGRVCLWDALSYRRPQGYYTGHSSCVSAVACSADATRAASLEDGHRLHVWQIAPIAGPVWSGEYGESGERADVGTFPVGSVAFSHDGGLLASGGASSVIHVWDAHAGKLLHQLYGHADHVSSVAFLSCQGSHQLVASCSWDGTFIVWCL